MESKPRIWNIVASTGAYWSLGLYQEKGGKVSILVSSIQEEMAYDWSNFTLREMEDIIEPVFRLQQEYGMRKEIAKWVTRSLMGYLAAD
jgi:hypothetical protein